MEEYAVNQFSDIRQRLAQLEADRRQALRLLSVQDDRVDSAATDPLFWRSGFRHPAIVGSIFWVPSDAAAQRDWFDERPFRPDEVYKVHVRKLTPRLRYRMATRGYLNPGLPVDETRLIDNTATLFARLHEVGLLRD